MASDWNKPENTWQPNPNWTQSPDLIPSEHGEEDDPLQAQEEDVAYAPEAHNIHDTSFSPEEDVFSDDQETDEGEESDIVAEDLDPTATPDSFLKQLWQYVTLIVFPLLFFGVACLLILPPIVRGQAYLPPVSFWFVATVLLIIAVGQAVAVYFSGSHHNMWILGTVGGLLLFILLGTFVAINPLVGILLLIAILGGCVYLTPRCIHTVTEGFVDIVYVSGKYERTLFPGFNLTWPWEHVRDSVNIEETHLICPQQKIQLSPDEDVLLEAVLSYQVVPEDAHLAVTKVNNWKKSLDDLFATTLQTVATNFRPTDFPAWPESLQAYRSQSTYHDPQKAQLPDEDVDSFSGGPARREHINTLLFEQMRDHVALWGIQIHWARIRNIELMPHTLAGISVAPIILDHTKATDDNQQGKDLVAASSVAQPKGAQPADARGNASRGGSIGQIPLEQEITEVLPTGGPSTPTQPLPPEKREKLPSEEVLKKAYNEIKNGKVTDPLTIRQIAATFAAVASDSELGQKVSFDAERAARKLNEYAQLYENMYRSNMAYNDTTQPDLPVE